MEDHLADFGALVKMLITPEQNDMIEHQVADYKTKLDELHRAKASTVDKLEKQCVNTSVPGDGLLLSNVSNYVEHLFIWRILCQLMNEEDDDTNIHPDFHEFISYFYRLIKLSVNKKLSSIEEFIICQYASILSTFDMLDIYRRKCVKAIGGCILVHFGQYETIIEQAFQLVHRIHPSIGIINERYQLITYTLNDIIQRCQNEQFEELTFIQCMIIAKVFVEQEKQLELNNTDLKQLFDSLVNEIEKYKN
ncbi:unnamed protein product [Rotaria sordida]|uniref:Uncharacterized protein n=1 Tax=Rotaria sordida TaxID=392033 RepID=A0A819WB23_9BILA|nr:unnamed protein product [Rotaria sordida]